MQYRKKLISKTLEKDNGEKKKKETIGLSHNTKKHTRKRPQQKIVKRQKKNTDISEKHQKRTKTSLQKIKSDHFIYKLKKKKKAKTGIQSFFSPGEAPTDNFTPTSERREGINTLARNHS